MKNIIDLTPRRTKVVRPDEFLDMTPEERSNAKKVTFCPPKLGDKDFGKFVVTLKQPVYSLASADE